MAKIIKEITLDAVRDNAGCTVSAKQNDGGSRFIRAKITADRKPVKVNPGASVMINALRPDGESGGFIGEVNADGSVTVPISAWMLGQSGAVKCDVSVFDGTERLTTMPFFIAVEECLYNGEGIEDSEEYTLIASLLEEIQTIHAEETKRVEAEEERAFSEVKRESAETVRETTEAARDSAERLREESEAARKGSEEERDTAEGLREVSEALREESEEEREAAEIARKNAEGERASAEKTRIEAESKRTTFIPSVSEDGVISWSNDKGLENPASVSLMPAIISGVLKALPSAEGGSF